MPWRHEWGAEIISAHGTSDAAGVAVLFKRGVDCKVHSKFLDPQGRYIILKAEIRDKTFVLINVYAPKYGADTFFHSIWVFIAQLGEHCSANAEATGSNPVKGFEKPFFRAIFAIA